MKILVTCAGGVSTSIMVESMKDYAQENDIIKAVSLGQLSRFINDFDLVLVAPQVEYALERIQMQCVEADTPCKVIGNELFGMMDGKAVMDMVYQIPNEEYNKSEKIRYTEVAIMCTFGISTNIMNNQLNKEFEKTDSIYRSKVISVNLIYKQKLDCDIVILTPQVAYLEDDIRKLYPNVKIHSINLKDFGSTNYQKIVEEFIKDMNAGSC